MFYLFFPILCVLFARVKTLVLILLVFIIVGPFGRTILTNGNPIWQEKSYWGSMDAIAMGCLTALLVSRYRISARWLRRHAIIGLILFTIILSSPVPSRILGLFRFGLDMTFLALATCMLMAVAAQSQWQAPTALRPLLDMGKRSYEIYLTHMFIVLGLFELFLGADKARGLILFFFAFAVVLSAGLGSVVARFYSEPMNRTLRRQRASHASVC